MYSIGISIHLIRTIFKGEKDKFQQKKNAEISDFCDFALFFFLTMRDREEKNLR